MVGKALVEGILRYNDGPSIVIKVTIRRKNRTVTLTVPRQLGILANQWMTAALIGELTNELTLVLYGDALIVPYDELNPHCSRLVQRSVPIFNRRRPVAMNGGGNQYPPISRKAVVEKKGE